MRKILSLCVAGLIMSSGAGTALAQDYDYHPVLSDAFTVSLGWMRSKNSFEVEADNGLDVGDDIDFGDTLGVSKHSTFFNGQLKWKFGSTKKWSVAGQYFSNDAKGSATLTEDVEWDDLTFKEGSFAEAGVKLSVARLFLGRSFIKNEQHDFGAGIGIHNLDLKVFISGEIIIDDDTTGERYDEVSASQILPNIGAWYDFSPAKRWLLHGRIDWISADIGDYNGHLWNINAGVNYQAFRHIGFDLSWQYFNLNINVDKTDWNGGAKMTYNGPVIAITGNW